MNRKKEKKGRKKERERKRKKGKERSNNSTNKWLYAPLKRLLGKNRTIMQVQALKSSDFIITM